MAGVRGSGLAAGAGADGRSRGRRCLQWSRRDARACGRPRLPPHGPTSPDRSRRVLTMPRAVVAGGAGFLGSHLCGRLLADGWSVVAVDSLLTGALENLADLDGHPAFSFERQDISEGFDVGGSVDLVANLA